MTSSPKTLYAGHRFYFGQEFANIIRRRLLRPGDKWYMDEVVLKIAGKKHYFDRN
jgi:putative transposase